jgi:hypothetical protein
LSSETVKVSPEKIIAFEIDDDDARRNERRCDQKIDSKMGVLLTHLRSAFGTFVDASPKRVLFPRFSTGKKRRTRRASWGERRGRKRDQIEKSRSLARTAESFLPSSLRRLLALPHANNAFSYRLRDLERDLFLGQEHGDREKGEKELQR